MMHPLIRRLIRAALLAGALIPAALNAAPVPVTGGAVAGVGRPTRCGRVGTGDTGRVECPG